MIEIQNVRLHYAREGILTRIRNSLFEVGAAERKLQWSELARLDQFHMRGLPATQELAEGLGLKGGERVLDVGCGLGGPARYLAASFGCRVTGIDLSGEFVEAASYLSGRTGLAELTCFVQGDATRLPFPGGTFDHCWTQHVSMNISDKSALYSGMFRVLKAGGRLAIYDFVDGQGEPILYPVPWATVPEISFLTTPEELHTALQEAGFEIESSVDTTHLALPWLESVQAGPEPEGVQTLNLATAMGSRIVEMVKNLSENIRRGSVRTLQVIAKKP